jgi:hypothetical protein
VVEHLPRKCKALTSNTKTKQKKICRKEITEKDSLKRAVAFYQETQGGSQRNLHPSLTHSSSLSYSLPVSHGLSESEARG